MQLTSLFTGAFNRSSVVLFVESCKALHKPSNKSTRSSELEFRARSYGQINDKSAELRIICWMIWCSFANRLVLHYFGGTMDTLAKHYFTSLKMDFNLEDVSKIPKKTINVCFQQDHTTRDPVVTVLNRWIIRRFLETWPHISHSTTAWSNGTVYGSIDHPLMSNNLATKLALYHNMIRYYYFTYGYLYPSNRYLQDSWRP